MAATDLVGVVPKTHLPTDLVTQEELEGRESDRYASYTNAFIAASYRRGSISLFNETTVPTDDTNAVRQPDIEDKATNGVIAFSTYLRTDRDPNNLVWASEASASQYPSGTVLYISIWNVPTAHVKVTLTSDAALSGTGDAAFLWATADVGRGQRDRRCRRCRQLLQDRGVRAYRPEAAPPCQRHTRAAVGG